MRSNEDIIHRFLDVVINEPSNPTIGVPSISLSDDDLTHLTTYLLEKDDSLCLVVGHYNHLNLKCFLQCDQLHTVKFGISRINQHPVVDLTLWESSYHGMMLPPSVIIFSQISHMEALNLEPHIKSMEVPVCIVGKTH